MDRCGLEGEYFRARAFGVSVKVDEDVNAIVVDAIRGQAMVGNAA